MLITVLHPSVVAWMTGGGRSLATPGTIYKVHLQCPDTTAAEIHRAMASHGPTAMVLHTRELLTLLPARRENRGWDKRWRVQTLLAPPITHIVDLSGCYLPGQLVPTVVLFSDPVLAAARPDTVRLLRCDRGEPTSPSTMEEGVLWRAVTAGYDTVGSTEWTTTRDVPRGDLARACLFFQGTWDLVGFDAGGTRRG